MITNKLSKLCQEMYSGYGESEISGISYFEQFEHQLVEVPFEELVMHQMQIYPNRYVVDFLLSTPFLWTNLSTETWLKLLLRKNARPVTNRIVDRVAMYSDIEFFNRYVGVDALDFIMRSDLVDLKEKTCCISYFKKFPDSLAHSDLDEEDLDGEYFVERSKLVSLAEELCHKFGFLRFDISEMGVSVYLRGLENIATGKDDIQDSTSF